MKDSFSGRRVGTDVLLQQIPGGFVGYRLVLHDPPLEDDFQSHYELGRVPSPQRPYRSFQWFGVSLFEQRWRVERMLKTSITYGRDQRMTFEVVSTRSWNVLGTFEDEDTRGRRSAQVCPRRPWGRTIWWFTSPRVTSTLMS